MKNFFCLNYRIVELRCWKNENGKRKNVDYRFVDFRINRFEQVKQIFEYW